MTEAEIRKRLAEHCREIAPPHRESAVSVYCKGCRAPIPAWIAGFSSTMCGDCWKRIASALEPALSKSVEKAVEEIYEAVDKWRAAMMVAMKPATSTEKFRSEVRSILERVR